MRSSNLNIIIKAIQKASNHVARDFMELENLQSNPVSANKFAILSLNRVKQILIDEFTKFRSDYDLAFSDGQKIVRKPDNEYVLFINPIDGIENLSRSNPDFTISVALQHFNKINNDLQSIAVVILKVIGGELFYAEKGFGAYLNNRRIRVSKRTNNPQQIIASDVISFNKNSNQIIRSYGCESLSIAYLSSSRVDKLVIEKNQNLVSKFFLLAKESGAKITEENNYLIVSN